MTDVLARLDELAAIHPHTAAISVDGPTGVTYAELAALITRMSDRLRGIPPEGIVEVSSHRRLWPWALASFLACAVAQRTCVFAVEGTGRTRDLEPSHRLVAGPNGISVEQVARSAVPDHARRPGQVVRTSGTTGAALSIVHGYDSLLSISSSSLRTSAGRHTLVHTFPPETFAGLHGITLPALFRGDHVVATTRSDPETLSAAIHTTRATVLCTTPSLLRTLLPALARRRDLAATLRLVMVTGESVDPGLSTQVAAALDHNVGVMAIYGLSQQPHAQLQCLVPLRSPGPLVYQPSPGTAIRIVDGAGASCAPGDIGELHVATRPAMHWTPTGDLARAHPEGGVEIVGRLAGTALIAGELVSCVLVEETLRVHDKVRDAAVFGVGHATLGQQLMALVVPVAGVPCSAAELRQFLGAQLKSTWVPADIRFVGALPTTPSGKTMRSDLQEHWHATTRDATTHVAIAREPNPGPTDSGPARQGAAPPLHHENA